MPLTLNWESGNAAEDGRRKYLTRVKYFWKIWKYRGNLATLASKSGGPEVLKGRALGASHIKPSENFSESGAGRGSNGGAGADFENSNMMQSSQKLCEISLKTTSNEGCGENTSLLKAL